MFVFMFVSVSVCLCMSRHSSKKRHFMQNEEEILREPQAQETKLTVIMTEMMTQACERVSVWVC
jgi:gluconate kinase